MPVTQQSLHEKVWNHADDLSTGLLPEVVALCHRYRAPTWSAGFSPHSSEPQGDRNRRRTLRTEVRAPKRSRRGVNGALTLGRGIGRRRRISSNPRRCEQCNNLLMLCPPRGLGHQNDIGIGGVAPAVVESGKNVGRWRVGGRKPVIHRSLGLASLATSQTANQPMPEPAISRGLPVIRFIVCWTIRCPTRWRR